VIRVLNRLVTALVMACLVLGPPTAVAVWAIRQPWRDLAVDDLLGWATDPPDETLIWLLVAAGIAALWLLTAVIAVRAAAHTLRRGWWRLRRVPLPTPAQATATSLAGTALLGIPTLSAAPPTDAPPHPAATGSQDHDPQPADADTQRVDGLEVADGSWIPRHTAHQVAAMAGLLWLRRRQTYDPAHPHTAAPALPSTVDAVTTAAPDGAAVDAPTYAGRLPAGDVTLTGPGTLAAARGLLVTALMANTTPTPRANVVITPTDLGLLLGGTTLPPVPGLHITDDPGALLPSLVATVSAEAADTAGSRVLYLTSRRPPRSRHFTDSTPTVVAFGDDGPRAGDRHWQVHDDGTLAAPTGDGRLCVLTEQAARDLLLLIGHAHQLTVTTTVSSAPPPTASGSVTRTGRPATALPARLRVLGDCRLTVHGHPVAIRRSAAWQVLVWLAAHPDGATGRQLVEVIWPGLPPATITNRLYTTLHDLRAQTRDLLDRPLVRRRGDTHTLDPAVVDVDLWHLLAAADTAGTAITTADRRDAHTAVIRHYTGEVAADQSWAWLAGPRETIRNHVIDAFTGLTDDLPPSEALPLLRDAIAVDPYNEHLHDRTITALTAVGDHTAAARLRETYTGRLAAAGLQPRAGVTTGTTTSLDAATATSPTHRRILPTPSADPGD
jgi:DNA-binding SARP family transcriptional activator